MNSLACIIAGLEHSGTTILSKIIASHPSIFGAFETGVMATDLPHFKDSNPFNRWIESPDGISLGLGRGASNIISSMNNYEKVYSFIFRNRGIAYPNNHPFKRLLLSADYLYDKCPIYIYNLPYICSVVNNRIPIFIILKKGRSTYHSYIIKRGISIDAFRDKISRAIESLRFIKNNPTSRNMFVIDYDDYMQNNEKYNIFIMNTINYFKPTIPILPISIERFHYKMHRYQYTSVMNERSLDYVKKDYPDPPEKELIDLVNTFDGLLQQVKIKI